MLGKLLKYELRATGRVLLPLYGTMLILSLLNRGALSFLPSNSGPFSSLINVLLMVTYVAIICATAFMTIFLMAQRFHKNLMGDEGYLMFTLPVPVWQNIAGKLIVSVVWTLLSGVVTFLSVLIVAFERGMVAELISAWHQVRQMLISEGLLVGVHLTLYVIELILTMVVGIACSVLILYAAIAIGHLFNRHRLMFSFAAFIAITTLLEIITFWCVRILEHLDWIWFCQNIEQTTAVHLFFGGSFLVLLIGSAVFFFVTNYILKHRLNLE